MDEAKSLELGESLVGLCEGNGADVGNGERGLLRGLHVGCTRRKLGEKMGRGARLFKGLGERLWTGFSCGEIARCRCCCGWVLIIGGGMNDDESIDGESVQLMSG